MPEGFYKAIKNTSAMLQSAWDKVSGVSMLKARGIAPKDVYDCQVMLGMAGGFGALRSVSSSAA